MTLTASIGIELKQSHPIYRIIGASGFKIKYTMSFIENILEVPSYGWNDQNGNLVKPKASELLKEFFSRLNIFKSRKNWLAFTSWGTLFALLPFVIIFSVYYFVEVVLHFLFRGLELGFRILIKNWELYF